MDRRFSSFILASTAFFLIYMSLRLMLIPPPVPIDPEAVAQVEEDPVADKGVVESSIDPDAASEQEKIERPDRPVWTTLGSMDAESGHVMLVTLNSRGAGIERIELTERKKNGRLKYRRVDVRSGYLGYFAADPTALENGVRINVVGPGTPADRAIPQTDNVPVGLKPGDVILSVAGKMVSTPAMLDNALIETKPGDEVIIEIERPSGDSGQSDSGAESTEASPESEETDNEEIGTEKPTANGTSIAPPKILTFLVELSEHPLDLVRLADTGGEDQIPGNLRRLSALMTVGKVGRREINPGEKNIVALTDPGDLIWNVTGAADQALGKADAEISGDSDVLADVAADGVETASFEVRLSEAEMRAAGGHAIGMRRSYSLRPGSYVLDMDLQIDNRSDQSQELAYRLEGVNGITLEGWWYSNKISPNWSGSAARDVVYKTTAEGHALVSGYDLLKRAKKDSVPDDQNLFAPDSPPPARDLRYIGIDAQYFTVAYLPEAGQETLSTFRRAIASLAVDASAIPANQERAVNTTFYLDSGVAEVPPGSSLKQSLRLFAGPKQPELFEQYGLGDCIYYGWFAWPAIALGWLLHLLSGVGNYALAIVLLTVIVRGAMFPLSRKAAVNAQRMQELAPELKKIAEKYKDDMEGRVRAQRELQQRVGFNPLSGCLPMFLQLPIFIGLYRTLSVDIELRQAAFASWTTWASNLAAPDMLAYWGDWLWGYLSGRGTGWLGPYFNILPVAVMGLFLLQQKMFMPPPTDEQSALTQKMMTYMTLIMGLFFFRVPAGLCIYFITSSLWGIGERILVKRTLPTSPHFDPAVLEGKVVERGGGDEPGGGNRIASKKPSDSPNGAADGKGAVKSSGDTWADRLRERLNPTEPVAPLPRDRKRPRSGKKKK